MTISFNRNGTDAVVAITADVPNDESRRFSFIFGCGTNGEVYAGLLTELLSKAVGNAVHAARQDAYMQGYKDAKAKRRKETWFRRGI